MIYLRPSYLHANAAGGDRFHESIPICPHVFELLKCQTFEVFLGPRQLLLDPKERLLPPFALLIWRKSAAADVPSRLIAAVKRASRSRTFSAACPPRGMPHRPHVRNIERACKSRVAPVHLDETIQNEAHVPRPMDHHLFIDPGHIVRCRWHLPPAFVRWQPFQNSPIGIPHRLRVVRRIDRRHNESVTGEIFKKRRVRKRLLPPTWRENHHGNGRSVRLHSTFSKL